MNKTRKLQKTIGGGQDHEKLYILVMGLTGAGKSTFISILTGNTDIPIGTAAEMDGVTQEVQDYILFYRHRGLLYEIHLIDSPGFDDGTLVDAEVLSRIAEYVNMNYLLKERLAGVLYLHDITKGKVGGVGQRNLRMLEEMIGVKEFKNVTLVTTKWGCTKSPDDERQRELTLSTNKKHFGTMLDNDVNQSNATMVQFDPKSRTKAHEIIEPFLGKRFTTQISKEMVDPRGPKLPLGETHAGKVVVDNLKQLEETKEQLQMVQKAQHLLSLRYDETLFDEFKRKRKYLRRKHGMQRSGRWVMRTSIIGGTIAATVLTLGPGAAGFALEPVYEQSVRGQRRMEKREKEDLEKEFKEKSKDANHLKPVDPQWLWDSKVQKIGDLESHSVRSVSSEDVLEVARKGEMVGFAADGEDDEKAQEVILSELVTEAESESDWDNLSNI
ncbi:uncharacterized protein KY384_000826 [Bacidia gigantensis]|uniref:uncharacterized protein n=1 Tax=Bacidia gigantensis TaxID=2732470 RepID=UPI001D04FEE5|nr:uncharacterized protein KY384_000826 [Bacidia gigantensis]KAG8526064.1 hypothetical protein KY384_000826 [Bacidia gigantensis]